MAGQLLPELGRVESCLLIGRHIADPAEVALRCRLARNLEETPGLPQPAPARAACGNEPAERLDRQPSNDRRDASIAVSRQPSRVALVSGEALVASVAVEGHLDVLARELGHVVAWDRRRVGVGLSVMAHKSRQHLQPVRADDELVMLCPTVFSYTASGGQLVELLFVEADG